MPTPDGSIIIDTRIDAKGINKATQGISKSLAGISKSVTAMGVAVTGMVAGMIGNIIGDIARESFQFIREVIGEFDIMGSSVGNTIKPLVDAVATLKGAFVNLLVQAFIPMVPYLISIAQWFTNILSTVTQIVAALFGYKQTVGNIMTKTASDAKKAAKEAKGALAAFDQINVLQKQNEPDTPTGPTVTPAPMTISQELLDKAENFKEKIEEMWEAIDEKNKNFMKLLEFLWSEFKKSPFFDILKETFGKLWDNLVDTLEKIKDGIIRIFTGIIQFIVGIFRGDWEMAWEGIKNIVGGVFDVLKAMVEGSIKAWVILFEGLMDILQVLFAPLIEWAQGMVEKIKNWFEALVTQLKMLWGILADWFMQNVWNPIANGFGSMFTDIKKGFETTFTGVKNFIKGIINNIIDFINRMIEGVVFGINTVIGAANAVGELVGLPEINYVDAPKIPRLATGAVIPPNSEFLAVLGDQRGGRNIEAPESLIRQIVREETGRMQADISIRFEGSLSELVRQLKPVIDRENVRIGGSLIKSGVTAK